MERRAFLRLSCTACGAVAGAGIILPSLSGCTSIPVLKASGDADKITVAIESFKQGNILIVRDNKLSFDILLVRKATGEYTALEMKCTHQEQPLTATTTGLNCPSHGSSFDLEGNVTHEPALLPLKKYRTESNSSSVLIYLK